MSTEEFAKSVIDIDSDGKSELVIELEEYPGGIQIVMVDGVNKVVSMEVFEEY